ncbi:odorant receptor 43a-like [Wyeomyia smithii]|uniref:odorant receptor 43a-like n=1 Tax=Wyeomyia smithii TaxID=174621 RepID=UPI0024681911|nr:odorant receptor 43a-like [Wyeomyia smithii]
MTVSFFRIARHVCYRREFQECCGAMQTAFDRYVNSANPTIQENLKHLQQSAEWLLKCYFTAVMTQALLYGIIPATITIVRYMLAPDTVELPPTVLEADFVFFDHRSKFWLWLLTITSSIILQFTFLTYLLANECFHWNLLHHVSSLFQIVGLTLSQLDDCSDENTFNEKLASIVQVHEVCYRSARLLERALSPVMAILYCFCIFQTCVIMFIVTAVDDYLLIGMMIFVLNYTVFLIFSFSMLGTELTEKSLSISDAVYNMKWYERSTSQQRLLLLIQRRSQKACTISAGNFFLITRATFAGAMQSAFSYFTIMRRFYD